MNVFTKFPVYLESPIQKRINDMESVTVNMPKGTHVSELEIKMIIAAYLFHGGKISSGQGADMVGVSKRAFLELLGKFQVSVFGYSKEELEADLKNA